MKKPSKHPIALNLPKIVALLIVYGRHILQNMTSNNWFPNHDPALDVAKDHLDQLETSEAKAKGRGEGAAASRDHDLKIVEDDMKALAGYVYKIISQHPEQADIIMSSAGMKAKRFTPRQKATLAAILGFLQGEVVLDAKAVKKAAAYEWQVSTDGGATWVAIGVTSTANTSFQGATAGTTYAFRFRALVKNTWADWSAPVSLTVH